MSQDYATLAQAKTRLVNNINPDNEPELEDLIEAASRAVDSYLDVAPGYFYPPGGNTSKQILGQEASFITLPMPLSGSVTITAPSGYTVPDFDVIPDELRLITLDSNGNPNPYLTWDAIYYTVTGLWGYTAIPPVIREATLQLVIHFYRGRDKALSGTITDMRQDEQFPERDYPRMTRRLLDDYKRNLGGKPGGGLYFA